MMDNQNLGKMSELNILVDMIVDYYCFKNNIFDEDQDEAEGWKKGTKYDEGANNETIPVSLDKLIETAFAHQLKKFTKD